MHVLSMVRGPALTAALLGLLGAACGDSPPSEVSAPGVAHTVAAPAATAPPPGDPVVGDAVPAGAGSVAVLATERFGSAGRLFNPPRGKDYFAIEAEACSGPREVSLSFSPDWFLLRMADGTAAGHTLGIKRPELRTGEVPAGGCRSGWVTFVVDEEATPARVVYDGSERVTWRIPEPASDAS